MQFWLDMIYNPSEWFILKSVISGNVNSMCWVKQNDTFFRREFPAQKHEEQYVRMAHKAFPGTWSLNAAT